MKNGGKDPRRYNCHTVSGIGVLTDAAEKKSSSGRDLILKLRDRDLVRIWDTSACFMSLRFPLIHARGENSWQSGIPLAPSGLRCVVDGADEDVGRNVAAGHDPSTAVNRRGRSPPRVSHNQFGTFRLHGCCACGVCSVLHLSGSLFQKLTVALWATVEAA